MIWVLSKRLIFLKKAPFWFPGRRRAFLSQKDEYAL
jgi:hypothetical protein